MQTLKDTIHNEGHEKSLKYCHYFNNDLICPYEDNGCMFAHRVSPACRYNVKCVNKLCQFRYTKNEMHSTEKEDDKSSKKDNEQETVEVESMENVENGSGVESCGFCGQCLMILTT